MDTNMIGFLVTIISLAVFLCACFAVIALIEIQRNRFYRGYQPKKDLRKGGGSPPVRP